MKNDDPNNQVHRRLPEWLKRPIPKGEKYAHVVRILERLRLNTVCSGAACPNRGECYSRGTATFMIMGGVCTRDCQFCNVYHGPTEPLETDEPQRLAAAVREMGLRHVVITSVTRDDLADKGAAHFAKTIRAVRETAPRVVLEVLTPDFMGEPELLEVVYGARPDVFNHNVETVRRLTPEIRSGADYQRSLGVLRYMAGKEGPMIVKSGFMLGLGEQEAEIDEVLRDLQQAGVDLLTIGQYLRPGKTNRPVTTYYSPAAFETIKQKAEAMGFVHVAAGPFVRSSYHAEEMFKGKKGPAGQSIPCPGESSGPGHA